jgi:CHAD domain-containing protein
MAKSKQIIGIDCDGAADVAIRIVLITRFEEMCALREQALKWTDPEGVHDMRVSSRRLRGAFRDFMPYLRKRKLSPVLKQLQDLADALGAVRDQDVAIIGLQKLAAGAPPEAAAMVDKLVKATKAVRIQARRDLRLALHKGLLKQLQKDVETAVDSATVHPKRPSADLRRLMSRRRPLIERLREE